MTKDYVHPQEKPQKSKKEKKVIDYSAPVVHSERQFKPEWMKGLTVEEHITLLKVGTKVRLRFMDGNYPYPYRTVVQEPWKNAHNEWMVGFENCGAWCVERCEILAADFDPKKEPTPYSLLPWNKKLEIMRNYLSEEILLEPVLDSPNRCECCERQFRNDRDKKGAMRPQAMFCLRCYEMEVRY